MWAMRSFTSRNGIASSSPTTTRRFSFSTAARNRRRRSLALRKRPSVQLRAGGGLPRLPVDDAVERDALDGLEGLAGEIGNGQQRGLGVGRVGHAEAFRDLLLV